MLETQMTLPLLSIVIFLPLFGAVILLLLGGKGEQSNNNYRHLALWVSLINFVISLFILRFFDPASAEMQLTEQYVWLPQLQIAYSVGVDGISLFFILLATFLTPICILVSWNSITHLVREYMLAFLVLETMMVGMFAAMDTVLFYLFFEGVLLPMFLIIGVWGGERRVYAAFKLFLYTLLGSILMLVALVVMYIVSGTTHIPSLMHHVFSSELQFWLWLAFFASFAVKIPMWPVHTWLPDAHVEAPTAGSVILAGVLLKMGGYGFLRFSLPMFPLASDYFTPLVLSLSVIAVIYTSLVALAQEDMKKLIAYSSIAHMGFVTAGTFVGSKLAISGAIVQMLSHGLVSAALFLCVGVVYDRIHSRAIDRYDGLATPTPKYALMFMLFMMASVGLPGTSGFIGEFMVLAGAFQFSGVLALLLGTGMVLGAAYMLYLYKRVVFGEVTKKGLAILKDLHPREQLVFASLAFLVLLLGVYPALILDYMDASVARLSDDYAKDLAMARNQYVAISVKDSFGLFFGWVP